MPAGDLWGIGGGDAESLSECVGEGLRIMQAFGRVGQALSVDYSCPP